MEFTITTTSSYTRDHVAGQKEEKSKGKKSDKKDKDKKNTG